MEECIDSTFVSSVGKFVDKFECVLADYCKVKRAIATVNGTAALHVALILAGVEKDDEVLTQPVTFVATTNSIRYIGANPVFLDIDKDTLSISPRKLALFLENNTETRGDGFTYNTSTGKRISACLPMHTFGHPGRIDEIVELCTKYNIFVVEDAAEAIGSRYKCKHVGSFGKAGVFSFNGNKTITYGGGGAIITNDDGFADKAKHITTTAKVPHPWEFNHDMVGFNYRMPNLNAALACAQMEELDDFLRIKRNIAISYEKFFNKIHVPFLKEPEYATSNYWLNAIFLSDMHERNEFLTYSNGAGVMTRPLWRLMNHLDIYCKFQSVDLETS
nr:LegC family aminotransferase [Candidatus Sigynarchaeota archaeon]